MIRWRKKPAPDRVDSRSGRLRSLPGGNRLVVLSVGILVLAVLPHINHVRPGIIAIFLFLALWRIAAVRWPLIPHNRGFLYLFTIVGIGLSVTWSGLPLGRDRGVAFLIILVGLKFIELHTLRDIRILMLLGLFVIVTHFLYADGASLMPYLLLLVFAVTWLLAQAEHRDAKSFAISDLRLAGKLLLQSIPFVVILFYLFPRLPGSLFLVETPTDNAMTGLGESLSMGTVSDLIQSESLAFTADFAGGRVAPPEQRYWRGSVFWDTDGRTWVRGTGIPGRYPAADVSTAAAGSDPYRYEIELQPGYQNWLFSLDYPLTAPPGAYLYSDHHMQLPQRTRRVHRYALESAPLTQPGELTYMERSRALDTGETVVTPRLASLVERFTAGSRSPMEVAQRVLDHFNAGEFVYTLRPPLLVSDAPVDEFLFESRRGFCGHYASSFAMLMRLAGIPSRMVVGYLGGEYNPRADRIVVRQSDAHAWTEIWQPGSGWVRVDPTLAIAPGRVENSIDYFDSLDNDRVVLFNAGNTRGLRRMLIELEWIRDAISAKWNRWFLTFDQGRQQQLLEKMGLQWLDTRVVGMAAILAAVAMLALVSALLFFRDRKKQDPLVQAYARFRDKLARRGLRQNPGEGPRDYCRRASGYFPQFAEAITTISNEYVSLRYGSTGSPDPDEVSSFSKRVGRFRPR